MSTKIYNAYRVKGTVHDLMEVLKAVRELHKQYIEQVYKKCGKYFNPEDYKGIIDKNETLESLAENDFGDYILEKIIREEIRRGLNTPLNVDASAIVYFYKRKIYVIFFGLSNQLNAIVRTNSFLEDYHYQNSCDQSNYDWEKEKWNEMSIERQKELAKDWREREKAWDKMIGDGPFYENGLLFEFVPSGYPMTQLCQKILGHKDFVPDIIRDEK
jgi:hypothetical protein